MSDLVRQAQNILAGKAKDAVSEAIWQAEWERVFGLMKAVNANDPRFEVLLAWLEEADTAYLNGRFDAFISARRRMELILRKVTSGRSHDPEKGGG